jgi:hypothetical protein
VGILTSFSGTIASKPFGTIVIDELEGIEVIGEITLTLSSHRTKIISRSRIVGAGSGSYFFAILQIKSDHSLSTGSRAPDEL